jgi:hypothetical protein
LDLIGGQLDDQAEQRAEAGLGAGQPEQKNQ